MTDSDPRAVAATGEAPIVVQISTADIDQARSLLNRFYYPVSVRAPDGVEGFALDLDVIRLGSLTVGQVGFRAPTTVITSELDGYHVTLPTAGRVLTRQAGQEVVASPRTAAVFLPGHPVYSRHDPHSGELDVKINASALEAELSALLGREAGPIDLPPTMDLSGGPGQSFCRMVRVLRDELPDPASLIHHPLIAERVRRSLLSGLLLSLPHRYHGELTAPARPGTPRAIRRAVNAIHDEPERPYSVADLAAVAGLSVRSLQEGFRRHVGCAPMEYVRQVRLGRVRDALRMADPARITVASVAHRWGFAHLGRFASAYRSSFGESPSQTLRG